MQLSATTSILQPQATYESNADRERRDITTPSPTPIIEGISADLKDRDPHMYIELLEKELMKHRKKLADKDRDMNCLWMINGVQKASLSSYHQQVSELQVMLESRLDPEAYRHVFPLAHKD